MSDLQVLYLLESIHSKLDMIHDEIRGLKKNNDKMGTHIDFVEDVVHHIKTPFEKIIKMSFAHAIKDQ